MHKGPQSFKIAAGKIEDLANRIAQMGSPEGKQRIHNAVVETTMLTNAHSRGYCGENYQRH